MRRILPSILLFVFVFVSSGSSVFSSGLVLITKKGEVIVNVLGVTNEDKLKIVNVKSGAVDTVFSDNAQVSLTLSGQGVTVDIKSKDDSKTLDAASWGEEIVEVEERKEEEDQEIKAKYYVK